MVATAPPRTTTPRQAERTTGPAWCDNRQCGADPEELHRHDSDQVWGGDTHGGSRLGLALEQHASDTPDSPRVSVQVSRDGVAVDDSCDLPLDEAEDYAFTILELVATARGQQKASRPGFP